MLNLLLSLSKFSSSDRNIGYKMPDWHFDNVIIFQENTNDNEGLSSSLQPFQFET